MRKEVFYKDFTDTIGVDMEDKMVTAKRFFTDLWKKIDSSDSSLICVPSFLKAKRTGYFFTQSIDHLPIVIYVELGGDSVKVIVSYSDDIEKCITSMDERTLRSINHLMTHICTEMEQEGMRGSSLRSLLVTRVML